MEAGEMIKRLRHGMCWIMWCVSDMFEIMALLGSAAADWVEHAAGRIVAETPPRRVFSHKQCQYITSSENRAHRFCEAPVVENAKGRPSAYCAANFELCCIKPGKHATNPAPATWLKNRGMVCARG
jgi:hypothetical protein